MANSPPKLDHPNYGAVTKRSIGIDGHRTSVSLEEDFWRALRAIAYRNRVNTSALVAEIGSRCGPHGLSSAIRQFVLFDVQRLRQTELSSTLDAARDAVAE